jgi:large subunit ribosomal protein L35Ae
MKGTIVNFRMGRHTQKTSHMIIVADGVSKRDKASAMVGKEVVWKSPAGKEIKGKVASAHGNKGALRVIFEKGMPGQSLANKVEIKA